jgi:indole-3-glycerol phosphate synthase
MKVPQVVSKLRDFGEAKANGITNEKVEFHLTCELNSIVELKDLTEVLDNLHTSEVEVTGTNNKILVVVRVDMDQFSQIPPYLYDGWVEADENHL